MVFCCKIVKFELKWIKGLKLLAFLVTMQCSSFGNSSMHHTGYSRVWRMLSTIGSWVEDTFIWSPLSLFPLRSILSLFFLLSLNISFQTRPLMFKLGCNDKKCFGNPKYDNGLSGKQNVTQVQELGPREWSLWSGCGLNAVRMRSGCGLWVSYLISLSPLLLKT